jgi:ubiquitin conjugation factor E4 B
LQQQWLPAEVSSGAGGHELPFVSLLGPFMAVSVFADENPSVAEKFFAGKQNPTTVRSVAQSLQLDLEFMRVRHIN